jgi:hypothetical protein
MTIDSDEIDQELELAHMLLLNDLAKAGPIQEAVILTPTPTEEPE